MAANYLGQLIHERRLHRRWTFGDLARACGAVTPKQTSRISQRLVLFEREGVRDRRLLQKVISALDLDPIVVVELLNWQRVEELAEWQSWLIEPVPIEMHVRPFAGVWIKLTLPDDVAEDESLAIEYARQMTASHEEMRVVLAVDRRVSLTFAAGQLLARTEATPGRNTIPLVEIGARRIVFTSTK